MTQSKWEGREPASLFSLGVHSEHLGLSQKPAGGGAEPLPLEDWAGPEAKQGLLATPGQMESCSYSGAPPSAHPSEGCSLHSTQRASLTQSKIISALKGKRYGQYFNYDLPKSYLIHPSRQSCKRKIRYNCLTDRVDNIFAFFFSPPCVCLWDFSSPNRN